jgi:hypothetical protein
MIGVVLDALLDCVMFLELSNDDVVDPDVAATVLDNVAGILGELDDEEREALAALIQERAADTDDPARRAFLEDFPESFGLVDGSD